MNKLGSILVELLISTAVSAIISLTLITAWRQTDSLSTIIDKNIDIHSRANLFQSQLFFDISGAFVPYSKPLPDDKKSDEPKSKGSVKKEIDKIFEGTKKDFQFDTLTFITTNSLPTYWGDTIGAARPRVVRIMYYMKEDPVNKNSYILYRQEGSNLLVDEYGSSSKNGPNTYPLISGIKSLRIEYIQILPKPAKDKEAQKDTYRNYDTWPSRKTTGIETTATDDQSVVPQGLAIHVSLYDSSYKRDLSFTFMYTVITDIVMPDKKESKKEAQKPELQKIKN